LLKEIVIELRRTAENPTPIPASTVRRWMKAKGSETRGATSCLLCRPHSDRISPRLGFDEVFDWFLAYFEYCMRTDPKGEWVDGRWTAGLDLANYFVGRWDERWDRRYFRRMKGLLADLYKTGNRDLKECVQCGIVEHLLERPDIRRFFKDWKDDPQLRRPYEHGLEWVRRGGHSPVTGSWLIISGPGRIHSANPPRMDVYVNDKLVAVMQGEGATHAAADPRCRKAPTLNGKLAEIWLLHGRYAVRLSREGYSDYTEVVDLRRSCLEHRLRGKPKKLHSPIPRAKGQKRVR
jgi:hypothetical protein